MQEHTHKVLETRNTVAASRETLVFDVVPPFLNKTEQRLFQFQRTMKPEWNKHLYQMKIFTKVPTQD